MSTKIPGMVHQGLLAPQGLNCDVAGDVESSDILQSPADAFVLFLFTL